MSRSRHDCTPGKTFPDRRCGEKPLWSAVESKSINIKHFKRCYLGDSRNQNQVSTFLFVRQSLRIYFWWVVFERMLQLFHDKTIICRRHLEISIKNLVKILGRSIAYFFLKISDTFMVVWARRSLAASIRAFCEKL